MFTHLRLTFTRLTLYVDQFFLVFLFFPPHQENANFSSRELVSIVRLASTDVWFLKFIRVYLFKCSWRQGLSTQGVKVVLPFSELGILYLKPNNFLGDCSCVFCFTFL